MRPLLGRISGFRLLLVIALTTSGLEAQGRGATIVSPPNPLFAYSSDLNVFCGPAPAEEWHRERGIARVFQFQLPLYLRTGTFGVDATGHPRYLAVVMEQAGSPYYLRFHATVQFARDGSMEVGRQSRTEVRWDSVSTPQVAGLHQWEAAQALGLARLLAERCRLVR